MTVSTACRNGFSAEQLAGVNFIKQPMILEKCDFIDIITWQHILINVYYTYVERNYIEDNRLNGIKEKILHYWKATG